MSAPINIRREGHVGEVVLRETEDYAEGVRAVNERRPGRFVGR